MNAAGARDSVEPVVPPAVDGRLLFCTFVYGWYEHFIPPYIYSVLASDPGHHVRIFYRDRLSDPVRRALEVAGGTAGRCAIVEGWMPHLQGSCKGMRWLMPRECFAPFDYAWIGDVDILHVRRTPSILSRERELTKCVSWPYVNSVWGQQDPLSRMLRGGAHFIVVKPYFERMEEIIQAALRNPDIVPPDGKPRNEVGTARRPGSLSVPSSWSDEYLLYHLMQQAFGVLDCMDPRLADRSLNGIHLGEAREGRRQKNWAYAEHDVVDAALALLAEPRFIRMVELLDSRVQRCIAETRTELARGRGLAGLTRHGVGPQTRVTLRDGWSLRRDRGGAVQLVDAAGGRSLHCNGSAALVLALLDGERTLLEVVDALCEGFEVDDAVLAADVGILLAGLFDRGALRRL